MTNRNSPELASQEILKLARSQLLVNFRFLDRALVMLELKESGDVSMLSDGLRLYYDPWFIVNLYRKDENVITRNYLHLILHLLFRHAQVSEDIDRKRWNLACDMAVENLINDLDEDFLRCDRCQRQDLLKRIAEDQKEDKAMNAERIYAFLEGLSDELIDEEEFSYWGDSHANWYDDKESRYSLDIDIAARWEEISRRMQIELELMDKDKSSLLFSELRNINRIKRDYSEFLRKFAARTEVLKVSQEEFDNNYYAYGLKLYGDMPIIEALEYSEDRRIREFVIAIDTSGSIRKDVAEKFVSHTYKMLSESDRFHRDTLIHIIQCDDRIREDKVITSKEEMEEYLKSMDIKGRGETDFRPVFAYVDRLRKSGELRQLKGMIYFTDGEGIFPKDVPDYDVAFIIHQDRMYESVRVPVWSMKMELDEEDIVNGRL